MTAAPLAFDSVLVPDPLILGLRSSWWALIHVWAPTKMCLRQDPPRGPLALLDRPFPEPEVVARGVRTPRWPGDLRFLTVRVRLPDLPASFDTFSWVPTAPPAAGLPPSSSSQLLALPMPGAVLALQPSPMDRLVVLQNVVTAFNFFDIKAALRLVLFLSAAARHSMTDLARYLSRLLRAVGYQGL